ncbi:MAG: Uma2 family endonuclease [Sphingomonas taxi]
MTEMAPLTNVPLPVRLRVEDYMLLDEVGAFEGYGKTELLDGEVVYMNSQHRPHARTKSRLHLAIAVALAQRTDGLEAVVEAGIAIPPHNVPEPDIVVTSAADGSGLIPAPSVRLIVEVADTTLQSDLTRKAVIYARNGVPEYWVADVGGCLIHQMWIPSSDGYAERRTVPFGEPVTAETLSGLCVETDRL